MRLSRREDRQSVPAEPSWWLEGLEVREVEVADFLQRLGGGAIAQVGRQCFQPSDALSLHRGQFGDGVAPALDAAASVGAGERMRLAGLPAARAARWRAWRSASVIGLSPIGLRGMLHSEA